MGCETIWNFEDNIHVFWTERESGFGLNIVDTFCRDVSKDADTRALCSSQHFLGNCKILLVCPLVNLSSYSKPHENDDHFFSYSSHSFRARFTTCSSIVC